MARPDIRVGLIPAGSTDCVALCLHGNNDPVTAALHIVLGDRLDTQIYYSGFCENNDILSVTRSFRYLAKTKFDEDLDSLNYKTLKNADFKEVTLEKDGKVLVKCAIANGFRNIQNLVQKLKRKRCDYDFVEILACPSGCVNGGAQIRHSMVSLYSLG